MSKKEHISFSTGSANLVIQSVVASVGVVVSSFCFKIFTSDCVYELLKGRNKGVMKFDET